MDAELTLGTQAGRTRTPRQCEAIQISTDELLWHAAGGQVSRKPIETCAAKFSIAGGLAPATIGGHAGFQMSVTGDLFVQSRLSPP